MRADLDRRAARLEHEKRLLEGRQEWTAAALGGSSPGRMAREVVLASGDGEAPGELVHLRLVRWVAAAGYTAGSRLLAALNR